MINLNYIVIDLETGIQEKFGRKANPQYNEIVALGLCKLNQVVSIYKDQPNHLCKWWTYLQCIDLLVGHNIKFDLLYLWKTPQLQDWIKQGGRIWDTMLAEYILSGQRHKYPALRDIAVNKYGWKERSKHIENLLFNRDDCWNDSNKSDLYRLFYYLTKEEVYKYKDMADLPKELVLEDVMNDVLATEQVYLGQIKKAEEFGMTKLIELQMDAVLATTEIEYNGIHVNKDILTTNKELLGIELFGVNLQLIDLAKRYWI